MEYTWAIGSSPGATDIQDFKSVGLDEIAANDQLGGIIQDNHTYYATLTARNGAGLVLRNVSSG